MKHIPQKIFLLAFVIVFAVLGFLNREADFVQAQNFQQQQQQQQQFQFSLVSDWDLTGWAFSSNIGWVSLHCDNMGTCGDVDYRVSLNYYPAGDLTGKGWSSWIGWVDFAPTGTPPDGGTPGVFLDLPTGKMSGWARATSALHAQAGGWDGWIKIRGNVLDDAGLYEYGVEQNWAAPTLEQFQQFQQFQLDGGNGSNVKRFRLFGEKAHAQGNSDPFEGYGWGNEVVGWLLFDVTLRVPPPQVSITANGADYSIVIADFDLGGETPTLGWSTVDVDESVMCLATAAPTGAGDWDTQSPDPQGGTYNITSPLFGTPPPGTPHTFNIECTGLDGSLVSDSVSVTILEPYKCVNNPYESVFIGDFDVQNDTASQGLLVLPVDYCFSPNDMCSEPIQSPHASDPPCLDLGGGAFDCTLGQWIYDLAGGNYIDVGSDENGDPIPICYLLGGSDPSIKKVPIFKEF